jgi:hypothetical protein
MLLAFFMDYGKLVHLDTLDDETFVPAKEDAPIRDFKH